jgi:formylglycine-generating enzyme required for sulfatase activity
MTFCWCPEGQYIMGSPKTEDGRKPDEAQILVKLSKGFWMAKTLVTQRQWASIMGENPSKFIGDDLPVEMVNWNDAQEFVAKLNMQTTDFGRGNVALPTEAQWEYACRAGTISPFSGEAIDDFAWYWDNSEKKSHPVGTKCPNAWGLHDMHGNLVEWCSDWYSDRLTGGVDPAGPESDTQKVFRGGNWLNSASVCRSASRQKGDPALRHFLIGFRPAIISVH